ncbi:hypothetical protein [Flavobacterium selenitireducens]|uniref:hypothetical protein n=1 Tax=Flavobacterium selenitireducens TaxID=2722704 RepID=UPI00168B738B|nr:hypothetical protein [Flavobacterium selenitireducens]MBD3583380.1 hypothetical protein [Flavobacterium selenitireducens]
MKKNYMFLAIITLYSIFFSQAQVGIGTTTPEGALDVSSATNGILVPRVALSSKIVSAPVVNSNGGGIPVNGTLIWNTATTGVAPNNVSPGFYYWQGTSWREMGSSATGNLWALPGNAETDPANSFVGTTDSQELRFRTANVERARIETDGDIGIGGAPNASAKLDISATNRGLLIPRVALTAKNVAGPITGPATSLLVYNTTAAGTFPQNVVPGFYYWTGAAWNEIGNVSTTQWALLGNSGTTPATNFVGTTDAQDLRFKTNSADRFNIGTNGQLTSFGTGSVNGPTYSWNGTGNANTGMFLAATSAIGFATNGQERFRIPNAGQVHAMTAGTAALPFYSFNGNTGTGVWSSAANILNFSTNGQERLRIPNANQIHGVNGGTAGLPFYSFATGTTTGMWSSAANILNFSSNGTERARILANGNFLINTVTGNSKLDVDWGSAAYDVVLGTNTNVDGTGINGIGDNGIWNGLVDGSGGAFSGEHTGIFSYFDTLLESGSGLIVQDVFDEQWNVGHWDEIGGLYFKILGTGTVSTIVKNVENERVVMHCAESPESLFEDYGIGELVGGKAHIKIDPTLSKNIRVDDTHPMKVFIQLEGDCNGVYVTNKSAQSFDVVELKGGTSSVKFSYSIVATRADEKHVTDTGVVKTAHYGGRFIPAPKQAETKRQRVK